MADGLVRARLNGVEKNVGAAFARIHGLEVLDEPARKSDGSLRPTTRAGGRPVKPKTSVTKKVAEKRSRPRYQPILSPEPAGEFNPPTTAAVSESADDSEE